MTFQPISIPTEVMIEVTSDEAKSYIAGEAIDLCRTAHIPARRNNAVLSHLTMTLYYSHRHVFFIRSDADRGSLLLLCKRAVEIALSEHESPYQTPSH